jgi:hypothetical protein
MNEISSHRIQEVRVFIYDILIVEEKLVRLQKLLLLNVEDILLNVIPHDLVVFHIIVWDRLSPKHYQVVRVNHM